MSAGLRAGRCRACGATSYPLRARCLGCGGTAVDPLHLATQGAVYAATTIRMAPPAFTPPYTLAYADFAPGVRLFGRVEGADDGPVPPGTPVELVPHEAEEFRFRVVAEGA